MKKILELQHLRKFFGNSQNLTKAVDDISFSVNEGEFVAVMGASGSGKTTLLNCISTIDNATDGKIFINGIDVTTLKGKQLELFRKQALGFIFQDFNLIDALNAFDNIALSLSIQKIKVDAIKKRVNAIAEKFGLKEHLVKYPYQLSGGQKQRVASARALIKNPSLVLADEPTGALDSKNARHLLEILHQINSESLSTILMVTHDAFAASYASRVIFLKDGKVFNEIYRGEKDRELYFKEIMHVVKLLGGE